MDEARFCHHCQEHNIIPDPDGSYEYCTFLSRRLRDWELAVRRDLSEKRMHGHCGHFRGYSSDIKYKIEKTVGIRR